MMMLVKYPANLESDDLVMARFTRCVPIRFDELITHPIPS